MVERAEKVTPERPSGSGGTRREMDTLLIQGLHEISPYLLVSKSSLQALSLELSSISSFDTLDTSKIQGFLEISYITS